MNFFVSPGGSSTVSSASGGKIYAYNNISNLSNLIVAIANPARKRITFHNPGTNDVLVSTTEIQNVVGSTPSTSSSVSFVPTPAAYGGTFRVYANGGTLMVDGECQRAWQALATTGTTNPLTVMETNV